MIKRTEYSIFFSRRRIFSIIVLPSFNHQTIIWYVGRYGFKLRHTIIESVPLVVCSKFIVLYIILQFLTCTEVLCESSCTPAWFVVILGFSDSKFRDSLKEYIQCWLTGLNYQCSQACNCLLHCIVTISRPDN